MSTNIIKFCCSVLTTNGKVVLPWTIMQVQDNEITFRTYFESHIKKNNSLGNYVLNLIHSVETVKTKHL